MRRDERGPSAMYEGYVCKLATRQELLARWDYLVRLHDDPVWAIFRENQLRNFDRGNILPFVGILDGRIICEMTAYVKEEAFEGDISDPAGLLADTMAYLAAFRTDREFENRGYFGRLYRFAENHLRGLGYTALSLGVGPEAVRNIQIYFHLGFREYIKTTLEHDPPRFPGDVPEEEVVLFYRKTLENSLHE